MSHFLDLTTWPRREVFEFYRHFDKPYFNVCLRLDVTKLLNELKRRAERPSVWLTYHYLALKAANEIEPFRYRLREGKVLVHDVINGGTTLILPNETFTLVYIDHAESFTKFMEGATKAVEDMRSGDGGFRPKHEDDARIHCTTLDESIEFLTEQRRTFSAVLANATRVVEARELQVRALREELSMLRESVRVLRQTLVSDGRLPSLAALQSRLSLENAIQSDHETNELFLSVLEEFAPLAERWRAAEEAMLQLPVSDTSDEDKAKIRNWSTLFGEQLVQYGFASFPVNEATISADTYRPEHQGFDLESSLGRAFRNPPVEAQISAPSSFSASVYSSGAAIEVPPAPAASKKAASRPQSCREQEREYPKEATEQAKEPKTPKR